jgi:hypothetical protein
MRETLASSRFRPYTPDLSFMRNSGHREPPNVTGPNFEKDAGHDVIWNIKRAKHNQIEQLDALVVVFASARTVRSFKIEYALHAANLPDEVTGELHVIVHKV